MDINAQRVIEKYQQMVSDLTLKLTVAETMIEQYQAAEGAEQGSGVPEDGPAQ